MAEQRRGVGDASPVVPRRPYLKPWYRRAQPDGRLVFEYAQSTVVFEGKAVEKLLPVLLPLLDGTRTVDEIDEVLGRAAAPAVGHALTMLTERGLLLDGPPVPDDVATAKAETVHFLAATGRGGSLDQSEQVLARATVAVVGTGELGREITGLLEASGVGRLRRVDWAGPVEPGGLDLAVAAPDPQELPRLEDWNRRALESKSPWLQVLPFDGRIAAVGPLYVPDETCCYECYRRRRAANVNHPSADYWALEASPASYPTPPPLRHMVAGLAAMLALQWLSDRLANEGPSPVPATLYALTWTGTVELTSHRVYRVPRCPVCFPDDQGTPAPWHD